MNKILNIIKSFQDYPVRRRTRILKGKIQIANAIIATKPESKPGRQRDYELRKIEQAKRNLPFLRDSLADCRRKIE